MRGDLISVNGELSPFGNFAPDELLSANFVYQKIAVFGRKVRDANKATQTLTGACKALFGIYLCWDGLEQEIVSLLDANHYPERGGALVAAYVFPDGMRMLSCERQLVWSEFSHTTGVRALVVPYDVSFAGYPTASSLAAHGAATQFARIRGFDVAIGENSAGMTIGLGEWPIYGVSGGEIIEGPLVVCDLDRLDEIFAPTPWGITSIGELNGRYLPHSMAGNAYF